MAPPITAPDTDHANWARELLYATSEVHLAHHCERSFQFAALLAGDDLPSLDLELLYIGTMLHDLALASVEPSPDRFEVRAANEVRGLLIDRDMEPVRANNVWDMIALHTTRNIAAHKSPETAAANRGISLDIRGAPPAHLEDAVRAVLDAFPRTTFPADMTATLIAEVQQNPHTTPHSFMESIAATHVEGFARPDFLDMLENSGGFR